LNPKHILITGASGLIGSQLTDLLLSKGYQVSHLGRRKKTDGPVASYVWDIDKKFIESGALEGIDTIINLAGAPVAEKPWTKKRKKIILESRTNSVNLIFQELKKRKTTVNTFISASAMGYYGMLNSDHLLTESDPPGTDFLANVTKQWEQEMDKIESIGLRVVKLRISVAFSAEGGALPTMAKPVKWLVGSPLGSGKQFVSWIHVEDLCRMFLAAVEHPNMKGPYNAASSRAVTNKELIKTIAKVLRRPLILPPVPGFVLRFLLGEMADLVLKGSKLSTEKIRQTGFEFEFNDLEKCIRNLLVERNTKFE
jgi:uncharacterized protein (TIGR01777 family)